MEPDIGDIRPIALTIAGSDSGGGAGIQADLKTFAQNTLAVTEVQRIEPRVIGAQIDAVAVDLRPAAVKSGMLADDEIIRTVAAGIERHGFGHYVLDPVMVAASGARLLAEDASAAILEERLPRTRLVTPNLDEASILTGRPVSDPDSMVQPFTTRTTPPAATVRCSSRNGRAMRSNASRSRIVSASITQNSGV